jgi:hypothetical protein
VHEVLAVPNDITKGFAASGDLEAIPKPQEHRTVRKSTDKKSWNSGEEIASSQTPLLAMTVSGYPL